MTDPWSITLSLDDVKRAAAESAAQLFRKAQQGRDSDHGGQSKRGPAARLYDGFSGFLGEIAAARMLGLSWRPGGADVAYGDIGKIECRTTHHRNGHLLIYRKEVEKVPHSPFLHIVGEYPRYRLVGWIWAVEAQRLGLWRITDPPAWWVPQPRLLPPEMLTVALRDMEER